MINLSTILHIILNLSFIAAIFWFDLDWKAWVCPMLIGGTYVAIRARFVYTTRIKALNESLHAYNSLPSYNAMMFQPWKWKYTTAKTPNMEASDA